MSEQELDTLLAGISDSSQREVFLKAWAKIGQGDPESFPVQFALAALVVAKNLHDSAEVSLDGHKAIEATLEKLKKFSVDEEKARATVKVALGDVAKTVNDETARVEQRLKKVEEALELKQQALANLFTKQGQAFLTELNNANATVAVAVRQIERTASTANEMTKQMVKDLHEATDVADASMNKHGQAAMSVLIGGVILGSSLVSYLLAGLTANAGAWGILMILPVLAGGGMMFYGARKASNQS